MAHKTFCEMTESLRAGYAAGMSVSITLAPDAANVLADILDAHRDRLDDDLRKALSETEKVPAKGDQPRYYLIKNGMFYRPDAKGYTSSVMEAGLFGEEWAQKHVANTEGVKMELAI